MRFDEAGHETVVDGVQPLKAIVPLGATYSGSSHVSEVWLIDDGCIGKYTSLTFWAFNVAGRLPVDHAIASVVDGPGRARSTPPLCKITHALSCSNRSAPGLKYRRLPECWQWVIEIIICLIPEKNPLHQGKNACCSLSKTRLPRQ